MQKTFQTTGPIAVHVRLAAGELAVESADTTETVVELEPRNDSAELAIDKVHVDLDGSVLLVEVPRHRGGFGCGPEFAVRVRCPIGSSLEARTASADVRSSGRLGGLDVKTASGDVSAEESDGETRVASASGDVTLGACRGSVEVSTTSGDVEIRQAAAGLRVNLISGDLRAHEADGGVEAHSVSGDLELGAVGPGSVRARTVSGDVEVGVKPDCDVWMDVKSLSGDTRSELEASDGQPDDRSRLVELEIATTSGDVSIRRARAAPVG